MNFKKLFEIARIAGDEALRSINEPVLKKPASDSTFSDDVSPGHQACERPAVISSAAPGKHKL